MKRTEAVGFRLEPELKAKILETTKGESLSVAIRQLLRKALEMET